MQSHIAPIILILPYVYYAHGAREGMDRVQFGCSGQSGCESDIGGIMGMTAQAYSPLTSRNVGCIRVVLCDPDDGVRAQLKAMMDRDPLLTVVGESRDWRTCELDVDDLVPELLIVRENLLPVRWVERSTQDTFAPLVVTLREGAEGTVAPSVLRDLRIPIVADAVRRSLDHAVAEIYDRKAKQLLYLVGQYVAASSPAPAYKSVITVDYDGHPGEVRTDTIIAVSAARKCVVLHARDGHTMLREPIHSIAAKLDPAVFVRIHRSVIVNCNRLDARSFDTERLVQVVMEDGSRYPVGRNYRDTLTAHLQRLHTIS
jgi:two-component system LytT family response regulator